MATPTFRGDGGCADGLSPAIRPALPCGLHGRIKQAVDRGGACAHCAGAGRGAIIDHEYVRNGTAQIFVEIEPLAGRRHVEVAETRTRKDWAAFVQAMLEERYPDAVRVRLVMDNLNTHSIASLYEAFEPQTAGNLAESLEIPYTPKHGSWLNIAEIELSALCGQCLNRRIPDIRCMRKQVRAWENDRNNRAAPINWRFTSQNARIKLKRLYLNR